MLIEIEERDINGNRTMIEKEVELVDFSEAEKIKTIQQKLFRLNELTKDLAQVQAGLLVPNIEDKKLEFQTLLNEVRVLQGKQKREIVVKQDVGAEHNLENDEHIDCFEDVSIKENE